MTIPERTGSERVCSVCGEPHSSWGAAIAAKHEGGESERGADVSDILGSRSSLNFDFPSASPAQNVSTGEVSETIRQGEGYLIITQPASPGARELARHCEITGNDKYDCNADKCPDCPNAVLARTLDELDGDATVKEILKALRPVFVSYGLSQRQAGEKTGLERAAQLVDDAECLPSCNSIMHADLCPYVNPGNAIRALKVKNGTDRLPDPKVKA